MSEFEKQLLKCLPRLSEREIRALTKFLVRLANDRTREQALEVLSELLEEK